MRGLKLPRGPRTIKPSFGIVRNYCFLLNNGLMNDAWLGQTVQTTRNGANQPRYSRRLDENTFVVIRSTVEF
jgi:hypothetical protein